MVISREFFLFLANNMRLNRKFKQAFKTNRFRTTFITFNALKA